MKVSAILPVYNEEEHIGGCLASLAKQDYPDFEVVVVDDGSTDNAKLKAQNLKPQFKSHNFTFLQQSQQGPGKARNLGAEKAKGEILVFVDADMEFERDFISKLVAPIVLGKTIGTFSKEEYLLNKDNAWARCWNLNMGRPAERMVPADYSDEAPVFRAIRKDKFLEAGGFDTSIGYTDDWSISRKLGVFSTVAAGARFYHRNPDTLMEIWQQARWVGKNEFLTRNLFRKIRSLLVYNPCLAPLAGIVGVLRFSEPLFFVFKIVYNTAVFVSVIFSFFGEQKYK